MAPQSLREKSWRDGEAYLERDDRIIVPVGSIEQHGGFSSLRHGYVRGHRRHGGRETLESSADMG